jgi:hypothetical protein
VRFFTVTGQRELAAHMVPAQRREARPRDNARGLQAKLSQTLGAGEDAAGTDVGPDRSAEPARAKQRLAAGGPLRRSQMPSAADAGWDEF